MVCILGNGCMLVAIVLGNKRNDEIQLMKRSTLVLFVCVSALLVGAITSTPAPTPAVAQLGGALPAVRFIDDCQFDPTGEHVFLIPDGESTPDTMQCGFLDTFEDPLDADSNIISLAFVILYAQSDARFTDPLVWLEGGPGGSGVLGIDAWLEFPLRAERDIILVDQRGTGYATPSLNCLLFPAADAADYEDEYNEICADELLAQGIDFGAYHTVNNATDVAYLITELQNEIGYDAVNLIGVSYGTRLGLALIRDWPELVRSAVLDSVYPPEVDSYALDPAITAGAVQTLVDGCLANTGCRAAFPNLQQDLVTAVERLYDEPYLYEDEFENYDYYGYDLILDMHAQLYDIEAVRYMPLVITLVAEGEIDLALDILYEGVPGQFDDENFVDYYLNYSDDEYDAYLDTVDLLSDADAMFNLFECQEEITYSAAQNEAFAPLPSFVSEDLEFDLLDDVLYAVETCDIWFDTPAPNRENERARSDVPTLLLSGAFDPITPPAYAASAAQGLPNAQNIVVQYAAHGVSDAGPCPTQMIVDFINNPTAPVDTSCIASMPFRFFTLVDIE